MDSLTHIALGACIGEAFFEKGFGKKAMLWGALAQSIPDIDFIASFWLSTPESLLAHRGFTHSVLFALLTSYGLALFLRNRHIAENVSLKRWVVFLGAEMFFHLFLDALNAYGIGWFEPLTHRSYHISFQIKLIDSGVPPWHSKRADAALLCSCEGEALCSR